MFAKWLHLKFLQLWRYNFHNKEGNGILETKLFKSSRICCTFVSDVNGINFEKPLS